MQRRVRPGIPPEGLIPGQEERPREQGYLPVPLVSGGGVIGGRFGFRSTHPVHFFGRYRQIIDRWFWKEVVLGLY